MSTYSDKIQKLAAKLGVVDEKMGNLTDERNQISNEITALLTSSDNSATNTAPKSTKTTKPGQLSARVVAYLTSNPGKTVQDIAAKLGVEAKRIGVAIYHLSKSGTVAAKSGMYFVSPNLAVAAKSAPALPDDNDDGSEEEVPF